MNAVQFFCKNFILKFKGIKFSTKKCLVPISHQTDGVHPRYLKLWILKLKKLIVWNMEGHTASGCRDMWFKN